VESIQPSSLLKAKENLIISASGWRKVFALSGDENDDSPELSPEDRYLAAAIALSFYQTFKPSTLIVAHDSRPTSPTIASIANAVFLANNVKVKFLAIAAVPETMAYSSDSYFFYITASHNPIGHNGFKFGFDQAVLPKKGNDKVVAVFNSLLKDEKLTTTINQLLSADYKLSLIQSKKDKKKALKAYTKQIKEIAFRNKSELVKLKKRIKESSIGLVCDMNGSSRTLSIDYQFLKSLNLKLLFLNDRPTQIVSPIVPEGENLNNLKEALEQKHEQDSAFVFGYMCDNDGDRGNIVYWDESLKETKILEAQRLFGLVAAIEMALLKRDDKKVALVVNGPTSLLVDEIAKKWSVELHRAEVGEANVVSLANQLREKGYVVRLVGEGSNGGSITHPSKVRDPLNTIIPLIKLLTDHSLFKKITETDEKPSIAKALASFTQRRITDAFSTEATLKIKTTDHGQLKERYEKIFLEEWDKRAPYLKESFAITNYTVQQIEGTTVKIGLGKEFRSKEQTGGLKILFRDKEGNNTDFIWMRGSQTEAVFRVIADTKGSDEKRYNYFLDWQKKMLLKADA